MSHAVFIKQKSISSFLLNELPSFEFNVQYVPVVLISKNSRGHFEWTRGNSSSIENTKGSLGTTVPTNMYLTPLLHRYSNFGHTHEMIIEHEYPNTIGNRKVYFVFFLQLKKDGLMKTPLDSFLDKDTPQMDVQSFVQTSLNNNSSQKIYYQTNKRDNVFIFPNAITVHSSKLQELTATPKPPTQVYNEVFLNDGLRESNRIPMENTKEIVVSPLSYDITVKINTNVVVEGFDTVSGSWDCYPEGTDEHEHTVTTQMSGDKAVNDIHTMFPMFSLVFLVIIIFAPLTGLMVNEIIDEDFFGNKRICFGLFTFICLGFFIGFGVSAISVKKKQKKMEINMVSIVFGAIYFIMWGVSHVLLRFRVKVGDIDFGRGGDYSATFGDHWKLLFWLVAFCYPVFQKIPEINTEDPRKQQNNIK
jgi:hypothetical protein